jgi:hypothetical protein
MEKYYIIGLPVYGRFGSRTVWDRSGTIPVVLKMDYIFDFEPKSELFATFPIFVASALFVEACVFSKLTGFAVEPLRCGISKEFSRLYGHNVTPSNYFWFKIIGVCQKDDFGVNLESRLVVSEKALNLIKQRKVETDLIYDASNPPTAQEIEDDLFALMRKELNSKRQPSHETCQGN